MHVVSSYFAIFTICDLLCLIVLVMLDFITGITYRGLLRNYSANICSYDYDEYFDI